MTQARIQAEHHIRAYLRLEPCKDCEGMTLWHCMQCRKPCCVMCSNSMASMCKDCRAAYVGPIWQLGKRADEFIKAELERVFQC